MHKTHRKAFLLSGLTIIAGLVLSSNSFADNTDVVDEINITVPVSCTLSGTGMTSHNADISNGTYQANIGTTTLHAFCNDNSGFAIYATGYTGDEMGATNSNKLVGTSASGNATIVTGTATSAGNPDISNWAMKLTMTQDSGDTTGTNAFTIDNSFNAYHEVPNSYTKVAHKNAGTDMTATTGGVKLTTTYAAYISKTQPADTYSGQVIYTLVHPSDEVPLQPQATEPGKICYYPNGSNVEGTMGCQTIPTSGTTDGVSPTSATLLASNFSREGYGFAGWSTTYDYKATGENAHFYGPQEYITFTAGQYTGNNNGLSLYAYWIKSTGNLQNWSGCSSLQSGAVTALTDQRDNDTYAVARLADGNCWMIENLRLDNTATLTIANTNNPLNDGTNVILKHNYTDTDTYNTLSETSSIAYDATTAPDGWCKTNTAACIDQSRIRTDNTTNRSADNPDTNTNSMYSYGNYYNWYSATTGRGTYSFNTDNTSVDGDLCPTGWRLPRGGNKTRIVSNGDNDFWNLVVVALNSNTLPTNYNFITQPYYSGITEASPVTNLLRTYPNNFIYSSGVSGASINGRGSDGIYWSSTTSSFNNAYYLGFMDNLVYPGTYYSIDNKFFGGVVRCIASNT